MSEGLAKFGALWKNKNGKGYSGQLDLVELRKFLDENEKDGKVRIALFQNGFKETDVQPDLILYGSKEQKPVAHSAKGPQKKAKPTEVAKKDDSDIPF